MSLRAAYWIGLLEIGTAVAVGFHTWAGRSALAVERPALFTVASVGGLTLVLTPLAAAITWATFGERLHWSAVGYIGAAVLAISAVMTGVNLLAERQPPLTHADPAPADKPPAAATPDAKLLDRLPAKLRGASLYAVEAQDHYLRLHTSRGSDLILMRLSDALGELDGIEGAQVHRSWWVARDAVVQARRADGRALLTLASGAEAPVSRTYVKALQAAGWL